MGIFGRDERKMKLLENGGKKLDRAHYLGDTRIHDTGPLRATRYVGIADMLYTKNIIHHIHI